MAAALAAVVSGTATAGVVRDRMGNPGVQVGGYSLPHHHTPPIPYSFIGALADSTVFPWWWLIGFRPRGNDFTQRELRRIDLRLFDLRLLELRQHSARPPFRPHPPY
jgi:hypothetical protein